MEASLEEIARRAEVGIGTLYRHFPSRDALLEAVFRHNVEQLCAEATVLLEDEPADEALARWMELLVGEVTRRRGLGTYLKTVVSADSDLFASTHDRIHAATARLVAAAAATGGIRSDVDPADLLRALSGVCLVGAEPDDVDQALRISRLLMDGLRYRPETAGRARG